jgi:DNA-binding NarL/FixJ family response regulator
MPAVWVAEEAMTQAALGSAIFSERAWDNMARSLGISRRELVILRDMFDGLTESAIAVGLSVSLRTVHTHVERLHRKLRVTHQVALALRVMVEFLKLAGAPGSGIPSICARRTAGRCPLRRKRPARKSRHS